MKKILLSLFVGLIGLINFGYCSNVSDLVVNVDSFNGTVASRSYHTIFHATSSDDYGTYCIKIKDFVSSNYSLTLGFNSSLALSTDQDWSYYIYTAWIGNYVCMYLDMDYLFVYNRNQNSSVTFSYDLFKLNTLLDTIIPVYSSQQCQTEYDLIPSSDFNSLNCQSEFNLIPLSSVDQNYCVNNNLCPSEGECPDIPGDYTGDLIYSNIYINNILHPGKQNIFINIPDYITWDYSQNEVDFNVYVGSGYDVDYINSIVDINSYRPTSEDFTNVFVSGLTLIFPYIFVALLILFIWKLIKRIFK